MKKLLVAIMLVAFAAATAFAVGTVTYPAKFGAVTFNHEAHQGKMKCDACHVGTPAKIAITDKATGHALCVVCHDKTNKEVMGKCNYCHKK